MGFMQMAKRVLRSGMGLILAGFAIFAQAEDVAIVGLFGDKAVKFVPLVWVHRTAALVVAVLGLLVLMGVGA